MYTSKFSIPSRLTQAQIIWSDDKNVKEPIVARYAFAGYSTARNGLGKKGTHPMAMLLAWHIP